MCFSPPGTSNFGVLSKIPCSWVRVSTCPRNLPVPWIWKICARMGICAPSMKATGFGCSFSLLISQSFCWCRNFLASLTLPLAGTLKTGSPFGEILSLKLRALAYTRILIWIVWDGKIFSWDKSAFAQSWAKFFWPCLTSPSPGNCKYCGHFGLMKMFQPVSK